VLLTTLRCLRVRASFTGPRPFSPPGIRIARAAYGPRSRLEPPNLPGRSPSGERHASFRNRPATSEGRGEYHALATRAGLRCCADPGGLKGRGAVDEARHVKHRSEVVRKALRAFRDDERAKLSRTTRSADCGARESSAPRAFICGKASSDARIRRNNSQPGTTKTRISYTGSMRFWSSVIRSSISSSRVAAWSSMESWAPTACSWSWSTRGRW